MQLDHNVDNSLCVCSQIIYIVQIIVHVAWSTSVTLQSKLLPNSISLQLSNFHNFPGACTLNGPFTHRNPINTLCTRLVGFSQFFLFCLLCLSSKCSCPYCCVDPLLLQVLAQIKCYCEVLYSSKYCGSLHPWGFIDHITMPTVLLPQLYAMLFSTSRSIIQEWDVLTSNPLYLFIYLLILYNTTFMHSYMVQQWTVRVTKTLTLLY